MMDSAGHIHLLEEDLALPGIERASLRHTGFMTQHPMPEQCDARKVLSALEKLVDGPPPGPTDSALMGLTPFERGYVFGVLAEYRAWRAAR